MNSCCGHADAHADDCEGSSLLSSIDTAKLICLNESEPGSVRNVFRPLSERLNKTHSLKSNEGDADLLIQIPFTNAVKIKSICISGAPGLSPDNVKVFVNRDDLDFSTAADAAAAQELTLPEDADAAIWHPVKPASKFTNVFSLTLLLRDTTASIDYSELYFIGIKGSATGLKRQVVQAVYEARPQLSDHEVKQDAGAGRMGL